MAIDTEAKRRSVGAYALAFVGPPADGSIDASDRAAVGWAYSGLTYEDIAAILSVLTPEMTLMPDTAAFTLVPDED